MDRIKEIQDHINFIDRQIERINGEVDPGNLPTLVKGQFDNDSEFKGQTASDVEGLRSIRQRLQTRLNQLQNLPTTNPSGGGGNGGGGNGGGTPAIQKPKISPSIANDDVITYIEVLDAGTDPNGLKLSRPNSKLSSFVLPCPSNLQDIHSVNFEGRDFGTANYLLDAVAGSSTRYGVGMAQAGRLAEYAVQRTQYALGGMNNDYLAETLNIKARQGDDQGYDVYSIAKGVAINPNTELVFRGVNVREFVLNWKLINFGNKLHFQLTQNGNLIGSSPVPPPFIGTSNTSVISLLLDFYYRARFLMYPRVDSNFASGYPAKFAITVRKNTDKKVASSNTREILVSIGNGKLNRNGEKMGCYIKDLQLDYIPSDSSFGASVSSYPTVVLKDGDFQEISLSMTVQEAALMNRGSISDSY